MGAIDYQGITIDGPPGLLRDQVFGMLKRHLFKHRGWVGIPLMSGLDRDKEITTYQFEQREKEAVKRIVDVPKTSTIVLDYVGFIEARRRARHKPLDYGFGLFAEKLLKIVYLPPHEVAFQQMRKWREKQGLEVLPAGVFNHIYHGYIKFIADNERRVFVVGEKSRTTVGAVMAIMKKLKGAYDDS